MQVVDVFGLLIYEKGAMKTQVIKFIKKKCRTSMQVGNESA